VPNRKARRQAAKAGGRPAGAASLSQADGVFALGLRHRAAGRTVEALDAFDQALSIDPRHAGVLYHLGAIAHDAGRTDTAIGFFARAAEADPTRPDALVALAALHHGAGRLDAAADALERALALAPGDADGWMNLGNIRREQLSFAAAETAGRRATDLAPRSALAWRNLAVTLQEQGRADAAIAAYDRALAIDPDFREAQSGRLFCLNYDDAWSAGEIAIDHRRWGDRVQVATPRPGPWPNAPDPDRRLRLGYVSGDFHTHPVGWFLAEVLAAHDRSAVEVFCYSNGPRADAMTARLTAASDHWRAIAGLDSRAAEAMVRTDAIDVLIDLSGHTAYGRLDVFARRPAPVQAAWLGYVATTGLPAIDYLFTDVETVPAGAEPLFSERLLRSACGRFCYAPPDYAPPVAPPPSASGRPFAFGSFNDTLKLSPRTIELWARVLIAAPGSRLVLKWRSLEDAAVRVRLAEAFGAAGVEPGRLDLRGNSPHADMLAEYADIDVALDPLSFSGGMTSCEALWMGVPVVTLPEQKPASRQTLSFLTRMALSELVAQSEEDYVRIATALAADPGRLVALRRTLRPRLEASPVRRSAPFARAHEALIRVAWRGWCASAGA